MWLLAAAADKVGRATNAAVRHMRLVLAVVLLATAGLELAFGASQTRLPYGALAAAVLLAGTVLIDRLRPMTRRYQTDHPG